MTAEAKRQEKFRSWVERHPARVEPAVELGRWFGDPRTHEGLYEVDFFGMEQRGDRWVPRRPVIEVPVMDRHYAQSVLEGSLNFGSRYMQYIRFRPVQMGLSHGQTRVRWYNWEPTEGIHGYAEADIYRAMGKLEAMLSMFRMVASQSVTASSMLRHSAYGVGMVDDARRFVDDCLDAIRQWRGGVRQHYVLPGKKPGEVEERVRER
jgi:hypothetical protein